MLEILGADNAPRVLRRTFSPGGCSTSGHNGKGKLAFGLLNRSPVWSFFRQKLPRCLYDPFPHRVAVEVALVEHGIRPHGGMDRRVLAVLLHEHVGGAVDVEVGDPKRPLSG